MTASSTQIRWFAGAEDVLAAQAASLPQPDQLCGPFAARAALSAVLPCDKVPSLTALALASGTAIWPEDVPHWRPSGAAFDRTGWDLLPAAPTPEAAGTEATGLASGVPAATSGSVAAVPVVPAVGRAGWSAERLDLLLNGVLAVDRPTGVVANVRTGPLVADRGLAWDVGHFVVLVGLASDSASPAERVVVVDSYPELAEPGYPPGCRTAGLDALAAALAASPGRGLLLLCPAPRRTELEALVTRTGHASSLW